MVNDDECVVKDLYMGIVHCVPYPGDNFEFEFTDPKEIKVVMNSLIYKNDLMLHVFVKIPSKENEKEMKTVPVKVLTRIVKLDPWFKKDTIKCSLEVLSVIMSEDDDLTPCNDKDNYNFKNIVEELLDAVNEDEPEAQIVDSNDSDLVSMFVDDMENGLYYDVTQPNDDCTPTKESFYSKFNKKYSANNELSKYIDFVDSLDASDEIKEAICIEINHVTKEGRSNSDSNVALNWLDTVYSLPWNEPYSKDFSLVIAKDIIEKSHYGMDDVKKRIIEFLAVRKKNNRNEGAIICLVGPPGVGKSSIAKSIAEALGKKFTRFSIGSLHDETDIVGHRRTYVGSRPGKLIQCLRTVHSRDPVILLDEIDKAPSNASLSALLEVLDSEQNKEFQDVYLDFPVDLSHVVFIITANDISKIPYPLLDRMELIEVSGYTENEKVHIATNYLIPRTLKKNGLKPDEISIDKDAIESIISDYTSEAGVRNLERNISKVIRKRLNEVMLDNNGQDENKEIKSVIKKDALFDYLGVPFSEYNVQVKADKPGTSLGLSVSSVGCGNVMRVEIKTIPGKGELILTGKLGEVIKESATIAFTWLKGYVDKDEQANDFFTQNNFHLHIPEGATAKDGPSAGIAFATAFYSMYIKKSIVPNLAMTGEINLLGEVTAIGGLKEKILGAKRNKVEHIIIPKSNVPDLKLIDAEVTEGVTIHTISTIEEGIKIAFGEELREEKGK